MKVSIYVCYGFVLALVSDQLTKQLAMRYLPIHLNPVGAWSLGDGLNWILVTVVVLAVLSWWGLTSHSKSMAWWTGIVVGAGLGNLLDRIWYGGVVDFIVYPVIEVSGNVADIWLGVAALGLLINFLRKNHDHSL